MDKTPDQGDAPPPSEPPSASQPDPAPSATTTTSSPSTSNLETSQSQPQPTTKRSSRRLSQQEKQQQQPTSPRKAPVVIPTKEAARISSEEQRLSRFVERSISSGNSGISNERQSGRGRRGSGGKGSGIARKGSGTKRTSGQVKSDGEQPGGSGSGIGGDAPRKGSSILRRSISGRFNAIGRVLARSAGKGSTIVTDDNNGVRRERASSSGGADEAAGSRKTSNADKAGGPSSGPFNTISGARAKRLSARFESLGRSLGRSKQDTYVNMENKDKGKEKEGDEEWEQNAGTSGGDAENATNDGISISQKLKIRFRDTLETSFGDLRDAMSESGSRIRLKISEPDRIQRPRAASDGEAGESWEGESDGEADGASSEEEAGSQVPEHNPDRITRSQKSFRLLRGVLEQSMREVGTAFIDDSVSKERKKELGRSGNTLKVSDPGKTEENRNRLKLSSRISSIRLLGSLRGRPRVPRDSDEETDLFGGDSDDDFEDDEDDEDFLDWRKAAFGAVSSTDAHGRPRRDSILSTDDSSMKRRGVNLQWDELTYSVKVRASSIPNQPPIDPNRAAGVPVGAGKGGTKRKGKGGGDDDGSDDDSDADEEDGGGDDEAKGKAGADGEDGSAKTKVVRKALRKVGIEKKKHRVLLNKVSGYVAQGEVLAIMGPSGAGKTTLLDMLAGRIKGGTSAGLVSLNGKPLSTQSSAFKKVSTYVKQEDIFFDTATVRETLFYAAMMRLPPTMSIRKKKRLVEDIIDELGMRKCANSKIGNALNRGISGGEKKRLAVGVGLLTNPGLIFLDEPTTGLDSSIALSLMKTLVTLARNGRTVICTIHQPRFEIFHLFDKLLLLSKGETFYFGSTSEAVKYFYSLNYRCPRFKNPADYFLDVMKREERNGGAPAICEAFRKTTYFAETKEYLELTGSLIQQHPRGGRARGLSIFKKDTSDASGADSSSDDDGGDKPKRRGKYNHNLGNGGIDGDGDSIEMVDFNGKKAPIEFDDLNADDRHGCCGRMGRMCNRFLMFFIRFIVLWIRSMRNNYRNPMLLIAQLSQLVIIAIFLGLTFLQTDDDDRGTVDKFGFLYFTLLTISFIGMISAISVYPRERPVFNRERADGMYGTLPYFLATTLSTMPMQVLNGLVFSAIVYYMVGMRSGVEYFFIYAATTIFICLVGESFGFMLSSVVPNFEVANLLASLAFLLWMLTSGFLVSNANLRDWYSWVSYTSIIKYGLEIYALNEWKDRDLDCDVESFSCSLVDPSSQTFDYNNVTVDPATLNLTCLSQCQFPTGNAFLDSLGLNDREIWQDFAILGGMLAAFRVLLFLSLRFLKIGKS